MSATETAKNIILSLLSLIFSGVFALLLPLWIVSSDYTLFIIEIGALRLIGFIPIVLGVFSFLWCYWVFIFYGRGTPWPLDPPKKLVVTGLYRFVRNPIMVSYLLVLLGEALIFESFSLFLYFSVNFILLHIRTVLIEEPMLRSRFREPYGQYYNSVPRWIPRLRAYGQIDSEPS